MKRISIFILFSFIFAQERSNALLELFLDTKNMSNDSIYIFKCDHVNTIRDEDFLITCVDSILYSELILNGSTWENDGNIRRRGWDFITSRNGRDHELTLSYGGVLGYGLYKIYLASMPERHFYIFYPDCQYPSGRCDEHYWGNDIFVVYDAGNFQWKHESEDEWHTFGYGDTIVVDICIGDISKDCFQPTTPENLILSYINNHPQLTWNLSEPGESATYEIYRKVCYGPPKYLNCDSWGIAGYTGTGDTTWIDNEFNTTGTESKAYYKVRAVSGDGNLYSPGWSNVVSTEPGTFTPYIKDRTEQIFEIVDPAPVNIYPNPFNSSIMFRFNIPGNDIRKIELYNLHGELLRMLEVNGTCMEVTWDGIDSQGRTLPSGLYLVVIKSGSRVIHQDKILYLK